jgi:hypothetical protein
MLISAVKVTTYRSTPWCLYVVEGLKTFRVLDTTSYEAQRILPVLKAVHSVVPSTEPKDLKRKNNLKLSKK